MTATIVPETARAMAAALVAAGLLSPGRHAKPLRSITGGEVETYFFAGSPGTLETIWVQRIVDPGGWEPASRRAQAIRAAWCAAGDRMVVPAFPDEIGPGLFASAIPERVEPVADPLLRAAYGVAGREVDLGWLAPLAGRLGTWLRASQDGATGEGLNALPASNPVVDAVADLLAGSPGGAPSMTRLARAIHQWPRLVRALQDAVRAYRSPEGTRLPLHGRFGPAAVVGAPGSGAVYITGWIDAGRGSGVFDAGYFVGELAECAATARLTGRMELAEQLGDAIRAFAAGYAAGKPPGGRRFPATIADLAGLKVVEHVARYTRHFGDAGASASQLLAVAESLVDPTGWLAELVTSPILSHRQSAAGRGGS
jgi:hypothetical protein